jgi:hypothetical protein
MVYGFLIKLSCNRAVSRRLNVEATRRGRNEQQQTTTRLRKP